jgi:hypothetical protein
MPCQAGDHYERGIVAERYCQKTVGQVETKGMSQTSFRERGAV